MLGAEVFTELLIGVFTLVAVFFLRFCYPLLLRAPGQQKHQSYRNREISRLKASAVIENQVSF